MLVKYTVNFQPLHKGSARPSDDGDASAAHEFESREVATILPNVGDYVQMLRHPDREEYVQVEGRVKSRLFTYYGNETCFVNIVVEEVDGKEFAGLIKE
jgi:hypothetical protein